MELIETLDNAVNYQKERIKDKKYIAQFSLNPDFDIRIKVEFFQMGETLSVDFYSAGKDVDVQEKGRSTYKIFSTIAKIVLDHVDENNPENIRLTGTNKKRADIFEKMLKRFGNDWEIDRMGPHIVFATKQK